jgi:uncharacterized membrane protein
MLSDTSSAAPERLPTRLRFGCEVEGTASGDRRVLWRLRRNCSIAPRQLLVVYLSLVMISLSIAAMFWWQGVPWVLPFASAELLALGLAMLVYARHATDGESIRLGDGRLTVEQSVGSRTRKVEFAPHGVRIEPEQGDCSLVELSGQGRRVVVGRHVRPELRHQLVAELRWALREVKAQTSVDG